MTTQNQNWLDKEILELFYAIVQDHRSGVIDNKAFTDRLFKLADRYKRHIGTENEQKESR